MQLHGAPRGRTAHRLGLIPLRAALRQHQDIIRRLAAGYRRQRQIRMQLRRQILHGMHGEVYLSRQQSAIQLLDKQTLSAHLVQRPV